MKIQLRQEASEDYQQVENLIEEAFRNQPFSDQKEHLLVQRLRKSSAFIPELSLVLTLDEKIIGHILLTRISIRYKRQVFGSLALAPVSVLPAFQGQGYGGRLIKRAHELAKTLGFTSVILLGHEHYYPRFGYRPVSTFNIQLPFEAPDANCMALELIKDGLKNVQGMVEYPKAFYQ